MTELGVLRPLPEGWTLGRMKNSVAMSRNGIWGSDPDGEADIRCVRVADFDRAVQRVHDNDVTYRAVSANERQGRVLRRGDLLLEKSGGGEKSPVGFVVLYDRDELAVCSNFVARVVLKTGMDARYWTYVHGANYSGRLTARSIKQSTGIQNLDESNYLNEVVPFPPACEQAWIADFLDRETAEIDAFIADQEELIGLLAERRAAIFTNHFQDVVHVEHGVRGGTPLGEAIAESDARVGTNERELMSVSIHRGLVPWSEMHDKEPKADSFASYKIVEPGDVVLNRMRAFQGAAGISRQQGMVSPDYAVFKVAASSAPPYISQLLRSSPMLEAIKLRLRGIGDEESGAVRTPRVNVRDLARIKVELPSRDDQNRALDALDRDSSELDATIADAREAIALSRERRAALISAAVTGKIDVREHGVVA